MPEIYNAAILETCNLTEFSWDHGEVTSEKNWQAMSFHFLGSGSSQGQENR